MRTQLSRAVVVLILCAPGTGAAQGMPAQFAGTWVSAPYELPLRTDFDRSVWGPDATSVRQVQLVLASSGAGTLTVNRKVTDGTGATVKASTSIEEATITVGGPTDTAHGRTSHAVTVVSAERRYPDDPAYRWPLDGLKVTVTALERDGAPALEVRFDTPEGRGSFWEILKKEPGARR